MVMALGPCGPLPISATSPRPTSDAGPVGAAHGDSPIRLAMWAVESPPSELAASASEG